jgi:deoxyribose-phosphate aldolase
MLNIIDHTLLKLDATAIDINEHCREAIELGAFSVCVNPAWVYRAKEMLRNTDVKVCTVVGFPLGANAPEVKAFEAKLAVEEGADEIDMVINIGAAKSGQFHKIYREIVMVKEAIGGTLLKVIIETSEFTMGEIAILTQKVASAGAEYIKTSTGTTKEGAKVEHIQLFKAMYPNLKVKASGGVRSLEDCKAMVEAGAERIGTSNGGRIKLELEGEDVDNVALANY